MCHDFYCAISSYAMFTAAGIFQKLQSIHMILTDYQELS